MEENKQISTEQSVEEKQQGGNTTTDALLEQIAQLQLNTVDKKKYEEALEDNKKLIKEITTNRAVITPEEKVDTRQAVLDRCAERTELIGTGSSYVSIKALTENYRDMEKLGMDVSYVDANVVNALENMLEESKGDEHYFNALMESRIKTTR